jgi:hypothetical protein
MPGHDDLACSSEHAELASELRSVHRAVEHHVGEFHSHITAELEASKAVESQLSDAVEELAVGWLGPRRSELAGGGRSTEEGAAHKLDTLWTQSQNGGVPSRLSGRDRTAILLAVAAGVANIAVEVAKAT